MRLSMLSLVAVLLQQAPNVAPARPSPTAPATTVACTAETGTEKGGFSGKVQPSPSNTTKLLSLDFRTLPCTARDGTVVPGRSLKVTVAADGTFSSDQPLPARLSTIDTTPSCLKLQTLEIRRSGGELVSVIANGESSAEARSKLGVSTVIQNSRASVDTPIGGARLDIESTVTRNPNGGINVGCATPQGPQGAR